jgi:hypothetical protein
MDHFSFAVPDSLDIGSILSDRSEALDHRTVDPERVLMCPRSPRLPGFCRHPSRFGPYWMSLGI